MQSHDRCSRATPNRRALALAVASAVLPPLAHAQGLALEEVIVTAQKKLESVQEVPATINPITSELLQKNTILEIDQVASITPGVNFERPDSRRQSFTIRGVTADPDNTAVSPITPYWNEQPIRPQTLFTALFDLERIEVLRGPQGTLRGRTDPSGSILVYTRKPNLETIDGYVQQTLSDNHGSNSQAAMSLPIVEQRLGLRVAGLYDENDGQEVKNINTGQDELNRQSAGRLSLSWLPVDQLTIDLTYQYLEMTARVPEAIAGSPGEAATDPFYQFLVSQGTGTAYASDFHLDKEDRRAVHDGIHQTHMRSELANLSINWEVAGHTLTSVSGYFESYATDIRDLDVADFLPGSQDSDTAVNIDTFSQELRLANNDGDFWEYIIGLYYEDSTVKATNRIDVTGSFGLFAPVTPPPAVASADVFLKIPLLTKVKAVFWHNKFYLTDRLNLQLGVRYQEFEGDSRADAISTLNGDIDLATAFGLPNRRLITDDQATRKDDAWTGTLKLSYQLTPDILVYGGYDRSFRPSGVTIAGVALSSESLMFDAETSDNFELGIKTTLADGRVRLNAAAFAQNFDGYQGFSTVIRANLPRSGDPADESNVESLTFNADAEIRGFESDFEILLSERWNLAGGYTYVDSRFKDGEDGPCNDSPIPAGQEIARCDIGGNRISTQPRWSANLSSEYFVPFGALEWYARGVYTYADERVDEQVLGEKIPAYGLLNLWTGVRSADGSWDASLWVKNATDEQEKALAANLIPVEGLGLPSDFRRAVMIPPRTVGLTGTWHF